MSFLIPKVQFGIYKGYHVTVPRILIFLSVFLFKYLNKVYFKKKYNLKITIWELINMNNVI